MRTIRMSALYLVVLMSAAACGDVTEGIADQVLEGQGVRVDGETVTIENPDGTVTTAGTGLPAGWPAAFPLPEGHQVLGSVSGTGQYDIVASITVPGSVADNTVFLTDTLPKAGFAITSNVSGADRPNTVLEITGNGVTGQVILNPQGGGMSLLAVTLDELPR